MVSQYLVRSVLFIAVRQWAAIASVFAHASAPLLSVRRLSVNRGEEHGCPGRMYSVRARLAARRAFTAATALPWRPMKRPARWAILSIALLCSTANALEIRYTREDPFSGPAVGAETLLLSGEIVSGDYAKLVRFVSGDIPRYLNSAGIILASRGGDAHEAIQIGQFFRLTYREVSVGPRFGPCVSACFLIFASAPTRLAGPKLVAFHQPVIAAGHSRGLSVAEAEINHLSVQKSVRDYLSALGIPIQLIDTMMSTASSELYWLSGEDLVVRVGPRAPWYEKFLTTRCGFDKNAEAEYFAGKSNGTADMIHHRIEVRNCADTLNAAETITFVTKESGELRQSKSPRFSATASAHVPPD
jgi:hypothetical protein